MILNTGEKVHIIERRYFSDDLRRHFVGEVVQYEARVVRVKGIAWIYSPADGRFQKKPEKRERVLCLGDRLTINIIPPEVELEAIRYAFIEKIGLVVTDDKNFSLDINEFTANR